MAYLVSCCGSEFPGDFKKCPKCAKPSNQCMPAPINVLDYCYDIETYPNIFTCCIIHIATGRCWHFEISDRVNQIDELIQFIRSLQAVRARMVGFNNIGFDYPVIHDIVNNPWWTHLEIYVKAMSIIKGHDRFGHIIWDNQRIVEQIDIFKIRHFDNKARSTSLKSLEIAMRMDSVQDLPFELGIDLDDNQKDILHVYNKHDVIATIYKYIRTLTALHFREQLSEKYGRNFINHNDTKIGKDYFIMEAERNGVICYRKNEMGKRVPVQTIREQINLGDVVLPYVQFENPQFNEVLGELKRKTITQEQASDERYLNTKGIFKDLSCVVDGLKYKFGTGGLHASVDSQIVRTSNTHQLVDVDVASYYPDIAIQNRLYPAHFGPQFCDIYLDVYNQRRSFAKNTPENAMLKLALNGVYGDSNNRYGPFYDPSYTMSITINGQMMLCMLVEQLIKIPGLTMIQANTDGVTFLCPREYMDHQRDVCAWWEGLTGLTLEEALYSRMFIRDVNNYIAEYEGGNLKRIGAYAHETAEENPATREVQWHKDHSSLVIPKAAEAALVRGEDIGEFIRNHADDYDFMIRTKVPRASNLVMRWPEYDVELPMAGTIRHFASVNGGKLFNISPPKGIQGAWKRANKLTDSFYRNVVIELTGAKPYPPSTVVDSQGLPHDERINTKNKSQYDERETSMIKDSRHTDCSDVRGFDRSTLNYDYYIAQATKLVEPLMR